MTRCGWSQDLSIPVADRAMLHADNAYHLEHVRIESHRLRTNTQSATAFRGFGGPQGMLGIERVMDHVAHHLGLDPLEVRRANYYAERNAEAPNDGEGIPEPVPLATHQAEDLASRGAVGDVPEGRAIAPPPDAQTTPYGQPVEDFILHEMTDALVASAEYADAAREGGRRGTPPIRCSSAGWRSLR